MEKTTPAGDQCRAISGSLVLLMAVSSGAVVANLYYCQPLLAAMARDFRMTDAQAGLIPTFTQIGYGLGLLFITPLGDRAENRRLIVTMVLLAAAALALTALVQSAPIMIGVSLLIGLFSIVPQLIVPFAANLASPAERSRTVGIVMSGLIVGILLARTVSGLMGAHLGWRSVYVAAAVLMLILCVLLRVLLPTRFQAGAPPYLALLGSLPGLLRDLRPLQQAAVTGGLIFAAFSVFWTTLIFRLESPPFYLGSQAAGFFGLVGAAGASAATLSGRFADRIGAVRIILAGLALMFLSWSLLWIGTNSLWLLALGAVSLDFAAQGAHVANQSRIFTLLPEARNRINTIYIVSFFIGGASGSLGGAVLWSHLGWTGVCLLGSGLIALGLLIQYWMARKSEI